MAAILKSKMAANWLMEKNVTNGFLKVKGLLYPMTPKKASLAKINANIHNVLHYKLQKLSDGLTDGRTDLGHQFFVI